MPACYATSLFDQLLHRRLRRVLFIARLVGVALVATAGR